MYYINRGFKLIYYVNIKTNTCYARDFEDANDRYCHMPAHSREFKEKKELKHELISLKWVKLRGLEYDSKHS